jgi:hypothetical protein
MNADRILLFLLIFISQNVLAQLPLTSQLGILDLTANGGTNPSTGAAWKDGDTYRLVFISSTTRDATSSDISDYNTHVQNAASAAGMGEVSWYAIASTSTVDAIDNTLTTNSDENGAFFLIDGSTIISNNLNDFWDGNHTGSESINLDENGNSYLALPISTPWYPYGPAWTGTNSNGTKQTGNTLGESTVLNGLGCNCASAAQWVQRGIVSNTVKYYLYGVSDVLTVSAPNGAGIIHVTGDPNTNLNLNTITKHEGNITYDANAQITYFYNASGNDYDGITAGTHWIKVDVSSLVDPITSVLTPETELTSITSNGVVTISFESDATISYTAVSNTLTFTDVDGDISLVDLSDLETIVQAGNSSITTTGNGSSDTPYEVSLTGANIVENAGLVPVTDGTGVLTWTNVLENITVETDGQVTLTVPSSITPLPLDLSNIPGVSNVNALNSAISGLSAGESGLIKTTTNNSFGMPSSSGVGVLFLIKK